MDEDNLGSIVTAQPSQTEASSASIQSELTTGETKSPKPKTGLIITIIVLLFAFAGGGYYYWAYILSGKADLARYHKGANLPIMQKDTESIVYRNPYLDALIYQKSDTDIYANFLTIGENEQKVLNTYGGKLISVSNDGKYCLILYKENPKIKESDSNEDKSTKEKLKNAQNNYYLFNFTNNLMFSLGPNISHFVWTPNNLFMLNLKNELLTYDIRVAEYQGAEYIEKTVYYKLADLKNPVIAIAQNPAKSDLIYYIQVDPNINKSALYRMSLKDKQIQKIIDTPAVSMEFSPNGKYLALFDIINKKIDILNPDDLKQIKEINNVELSPLKLEWFYNDKNEEAGFYFFVKNGEYSKKISSESIPYYHNLIRYDIQQSKKETVINGKSKNIADVTNLISYEGKIIFSTLQNGNIYLAEAK